MNGKDYPGEDQRIWFNGEVIFLLSNLIEYQGSLFLEFDSKLKLGDQLIYFHKTLKNCGIYNLKRVMISRVLRILAFQKRFKSLYDEIFNIVRFLEY